MGMVTTVKINTGEKIHMLDCRVVEHSKIRQCVVKCISNLYKDNKPTQQEISKALKKIKNNEVEKYFYAGYIIITVNEDGVDSFYIYNGGIV